MAFDIAAEKLFRPFVEPKGDRTWKVRLLSTLPGSSAAHSEPITKRLIIFHRYLVHIREFATASLRELKRLDGTTRSPVQIQFTASLAGLVAIRAFGAVDDTQATFVRLLEHNAQSWFWWLIGNRWIGFRLDIMCTVLVAVSVGLAMALRDHLDTGLLGLAFVYINGLSGSFQYMVRQSALVETYMTSVERLLYYSRRVVREEDGTMDTEKRNPKVLVAPEHTWPSEGAIVCSNLHARYRHDLPDVLHGVTFVASAGSKLGIVGRTGAGKSSLGRCLVETLLWCLVGSAHAWVTPRRRRSLRWRLNNNYTLWWRLTLRMIRCCRCTPFARVASDPRTQHVHCSIVCHLHIQEFMVQATLL
eukprot:m.843312 g.843312  ORF g.843312 m.843312 type:complete len:360 (+) comp23472_c0_seq20:3275-4354(+)